MTAQYLPLAEYSSKYRVSISTLRRRIKSEDIRFVFEDGKYFIQDDPMGTHQRVHRPSPNISEETLMSAHTVRESAPMFGMQSAQHGGPQTSAFTEPASVASSTSPAAGALDEPVLEVASRLLTELKKAYSQILHEKEEQILHLKEELLDLKTLVRVLESENDRLNRQQK